MKIWKFRIVNATKLYYNVEWWKTLIPTNVNLPKYPPRYVWLGLCIINNSGDGK